MGSGQHRLRDSAQDVFFVNEAHLGVELGEGVDAKAKQAAMLERGLVTNAVTATALRLAPPITVTADEIGEAMAIMTEVLA